MRIVRHKLDINFPGKYFFIYENERLLCKENLCKENIQSYEILSDECLSDE